MLTINGSRVLRGESEIIDVYATKIELRNTVGNRAMGFLLYQTPVLSFK